MLSDTVEETSKRLIAVQEAGAAQPEAERVQRYCGRTQSWKARHQYWAKGRRVESEKGGWGVSKKGAEKGGALGIYEVG